MAAEAVSRNPAAAVGVIASRAGPFVVTLLSTSAGVTVATNAYMLACSPNAVAATLPL